MMSNRLDNRVAIVTGAGRGLGRAHALALAEQGASIVVNDLGVSTEGNKTAETPADQVVSEIKAMGGNAITSRHDIADWSEAGELINSALDAFGRLDILVNNAGILRDRSFANMSEQEWDDVIRVHLKGHAATSHHAFAHWKKLYKKNSQPVNGSIINTSSVAGLFPNFGQGNYVAAKAAIAALTQTLALEGTRMGVRVNAISPSAKTRLIEGSAIEVDEQQGTFDDYAPENVSPLVVWLADAACPANGQLYQVFGRKLGIYRLTSIVETITQEGRWTLDQLDSELPKHLQSVNTAEQAISILLEGKSDYE